MQKELPAEKAEIGFRPEQPRKESYLSIPAKKA
jgi:hypothetical protein